LRKDSNRYSATNDPDQLNTFTPKKREDSQVDIFDDIRLPDALVISEDHVGELGEDLLVSCHLWKSRDFIYTFLLGDFSRLKGAAIGGIQQTSSCWSDS
jgi:hypothetical protein